MRMKELLGSVICLYYISSLISISASPTLFSSPTYIYHRDDTSLLPLPLSKSFEFDLKDNFDVDLGVSKVERWERLKAIAQYPIKGWNSWDSFAGPSNESIVRGHIDFISENLLSFGYTLVCIDAGWYSINDTAIIDNNGRPQPNPAIFPSAINMTGFKRLSTYAHSKGLLFGIHTMRGAHVEAIKQKSPILGTNYTVDQVFNKSGVCPWWDQFYSLNMSHPGAQIFYNSLYSQYAEWGLDFIKNDCMFAATYIEDNIIATSLAIDNSGREILYSLSPGGNATVAEVAVVANITSMYRITDDVWDSWDHLEDHIIDNVVAIHKFIGYPAGKYNLPSYPDLDMLPLGWISYQSHIHLSNFTADEQMTLMAYWFIWRSPIIYGGNLLHPDPFSLSLITNKDGLTITDYSINNAPLYHNTSISIWRADHKLYATNGISFLTIHNWTNKNTTTIVSIIDARGEQGGIICQLREVWSSKELGSFDEIIAKLTSHQTLFVVLHDCTN